MTIFVKQTDPVTAQDCLRSFDGMTGPQVSTSMAAINTVTFVLVNEAAYTAAIQAHQDALDSARH